MENILPPEKFLKNSVIINKYPSWYDMTTGAFLSHETHELIIEKFINWILCCNEDKTIEYLIYDLPTEGFNYTTLNNLSIAAQAFPDKKHVLCTSMLGTKKNIDHWESLCRRFKIKNTNIVICFAPGIFESWCREQYKGGLTLTNNYADIKKRFLFLNNNDKQFRLFLLGLLELKNCLKHAHWGYNNYDGFPRGTKYKFLLNKYPNIKNAVESLVLPKIIDTEFTKEQKIFNDTLTGFDPLLHYGDNIVNFYNESALIVSTETQFISTENASPNTAEGHSILSNTSFIDHAFLTEKTFKAVASKKPFIIVGYHGALKELADYGYKTFSPFIDESYDDIIDHSRRLDAISNEIARICNLSELKFENWYYRCKEIAEYNYDLIMSKQEEYHYYNLNPTV